MSYPVTDFHVGSTVTATDSRDWTQAANGMPLCHHRSSGSLRQFLAVHRLTAAELATLMAHAQAQISAGTGFVFAFDHGDATITTAAQYLTWPTFQWTGVDFLVKVKLTETVAVPLLDQYPATLGYSLRKLTSSANYAVELRRSSDSTTQDIGFDGLGLDSDAATAFTGSGDGFVATLYDQMGTGDDLAQATTGDQIPLIESGVLKTSNGKSALDTSDGKVVAGSVSLSGTATAFVVMERGVDGAVALSGPTSGVYAGIGAQGNAATALEFSSGTPTYRINGTAFAGSTRDDMFSAMGSGQCLVVIEGFDAASYTGLAIPYEYNSIYWMLRYQELLIYPSSTVDVAAVESAINAYYGIW